jgi:hypothetical protein
VQVGTSGRQAASVAHQPSLTARYPRSVIDLGSINGLPYTYEVPPGGRGYSASRVPVVTALRFPSRPDAKCSCDSFGADFFCSRQMQPAPPGLEPPARFPIVRRSAIDVHGGSAVDTRNPSQIIDLKVVARVGIEPTTRGFSALIANSPYCAARPSG